MHTYLGHVNGLEWHLVYEADGEPQVLGNGSYGKVKLRIVIPFRNLKMC